MNHNYDFVDHLVDHFDHSVVTSQNIHIYNHLLIDYCTVSVLTVHK